MSWLRKSAKLIGIVNNTRRDSVQKVQSEHSHNTISEKPKKIHTMTTNTQHTPVSVNTNAENSSSIYISNLPRHINGSCLLLIDPQNDFVTGSLSVPGAVEDCARLVNFIHRNTDNIQEIYVTMDTHMNYHIAHPLFWEDATTNKAPKHFTEITHQDIIDGKFTPIDKSQGMKDWVLHYTKELEAKGQFKLTIWPPHCIIGSKGHNVEPGVAKALADWERDLQTTKCVHYIFKGNNSKTEHYSALKAEVEVADDKNTRLNTILLNDLKTHRKIYIAGEAKSHCVNFTVRHLVSELGDEEARNKLVLLDLGMSSVSGFEAQGAEFFKEMMRKGIKIKNIETCKVEEFADVEVLPDIIPEQVEKAAKAKLGQKKTNGLTSI